MKLHAVSNQTRPQVALILPAYNEEASLPPLLRSIADQQSGWESSGLDVHVWVVNDGSQDQTPTVLRRARAERGLSLQWIEHPLNLGIGKTVQTGMRAAIHAGADILIQMDSDGQHPPEEIRALLAPILSHQADWVIGSRYLPGSRTNVSSVWREGGTRFFSYWVKLLTGTRVYDTTSGFRAWSRRAALELVAQYPDDYPEVQSLVIAKRLGHRVVEVPVRMRARDQGTSSITPLRSAYYMVKVLLATGVEALRHSRVRR